VKQIVSVIPAPRLLPAVHGLRGLAATSVVLFHLHHLNNLALPGELSFIGTHFGLGVQLFFVLSAFSLFYSTTPSIGKSGWARDYFFKRFFRIAPLFYVMLVAWTALFYSRQAPPPKLDLLLNLVFAYNFVPGKHESIVAAGWTIGVEMVLYAILPVLFLTLTRLRSAVIFFFFAVTVSLIARVALLRMGGAVGQYAHFAFITSLGVFAAGILAFFAYRALGRSPSDRTCGAPLSAVNWGLVAVDVALFVGLASPLGAVLLSAGRADILVWALLFGVVLVWQALFPLRPLASNAMEFVGERSYSIYLLHPMMIFWLTPVNQRLYAEVESFIGAWAFLACAALTLAVVIGGAALTYRIVEVPGINLGRILIAGARRREAPALRAP